MFFSPTETSAIFILNLQEVILLEIININAKQSAVIGDSHFVTETEGMDTWQCNRQERIEVPIYNKSIITYPVQAVFAVFPIKVLETFHVLLVNNLVEELVDGSHRDSTNSRSVGRFRRVWFALCKNTIEDIIIEPKAHFMC